MIWINTEALKGMEKVAEHINEMQRIHEEYGAIFDHLFRQHQKSCKQPIDLSPGRFIVRTKSQMNYVVICFCQSDRNYLRKSFQQVIFCIMVASNG